MVCRSEIDVSGILVCVRPSLWCWFLMMVCEQDLFLIKPKDGVWSLCLVRQPFHFLARQSLW